MAAGKFDPETAINRLLDQIAHIEDPVEQARDATWLLAVLVEANAEASEIRAQAAVEMAKLGMSYQDIANQLSISRGRAQQLVKQFRAGKRPGVLEVMAKTRAAELMARGADEEELVLKIVPLLRKHQGGWNLTAQVIAQYLKVPVAMVRPVLKAVDAEIAKAKLEA